LAQLGLLQLDDTLGQVATANLHVVGYVGAALLQPVLQRLGRVAVALELIASQVDTTTQARVH